MTKFELFIEEYKKLCEKHKLHIAVCGYMGEMGVFSGKGYKGDYDTSSLENHTDRKRGDS